MVNPACAGMILIHDWWVVRVPGKPRVCGDDPATEGSGYVDPG